MLNIIKRNLFLVIFLTCFATLLAKAHELVSEMDKLNMAVMNDLSGRGYRDVNGYFDVQDSTYFKRAQSNIRAHYPNRFIQFTNISFAHFGKKGWTEHALAELEADVHNGARGLKIYKDLGMEFKDDQGKRIPVDDSRLDAIWEKCGLLHIPVLIHSADPPSFWDPMDKYNERWLELKTHPDRKRENANQYDETQFVLWITWPSSNFI
jgi:predicted TIM-barrel fold metal-dependent hydrolase